MKASELIALLQSAIRDGGDRPVEFYCDPLVKLNCGFRPVEHVNDCIAAVNSISLITSKQWRDSKLEEAGTVITIGEDGLSMSRPAKLFCACWFSINTGPGGACEKCGRLPDPSRLRA